MKLFAWRNYLSQKITQLRGHRLSSFGIFLLLVGAGYVGNYCSIVLFFSVNFLFGSIAVLLATSLYGVLPGAIAAIISSYYTWIIWEHPYAIIIFTVEAIFVGWQMQRKFKNIVLFDSIYWLILGIPLVLLFYAQVMAMPLQSALLIAFKQAVNGIFNALIVSLLLAHTPLYRLATRPDLKRVISLQQTLFNWLVAFVFVPVLLLLILDSRSLLVDVEATIQDKLQSTSDNLVVQLQTWQQRRIDAIASLGLLANDATSENMAMVRSAFPDWKRLFFLEDTPQSVIPQNLPLGFSWQPSGIWLKQTVNNREIIAQFEKNYLEKLLATYKSNITLQLTLFDEEQNAIAATNQPLNLDLPHIIKPFPNGSYQWIPDSDLPIMAEWKQSYYIRQTHLGTNSDWTLQTAIPALPHILSLEVAYSWSLFILLLATALALLCATLLSRSLLNPLHHLTQLTHNLPNKLLDRTEVPWFKTGVIEINALLDNFQSMAIALQDKFQEIQTANATLEQRVSERTQALTASETQLREKAEQLQNTLTDLRRTQTQLVKTEKMSSLGQMVTGITHEIKNPVNFVFGNLTHVKDDIEDLFYLLKLYQNHYPHPTPEIADEIEAIDLNFLQRDLPKLLNSMTRGVERIRDIILSLRNFSRLDETSIKVANIHDGLETTLMILHNRLKPKPDYPGITVIKEYSQLPEIECYPGELNQVFMNLITNAIDALEETWDRYQAQSQDFKPVLRLQTRHRDSDWITIHIIDNGWGIPEDKQPYLFDPFFTTKPVGKGTGLGLSIGYQIVVEHHQGFLTCHSRLGEGTEFTIEIPCQADATAAKISA
ncbi:MAG: ATP-binding protein [Jaaginema sp. PMC 1079.18]|nr:ATP-binding protein [Jaaginema sp. PMC 1080.18]MEC4849825.1 ATP-binding protein [Jaaginema sp. PMC 1079.18]MEC4865269.1 ATP-binding protein [Jaaginema sp. PMC 1078.18]